MDEKRLDKIPHKCVLQIKGVYNDLNTAEQKAVDFLLENPQLIPHLSIVSFASKAGCSEATIVRVAKRLGYDGYLRLKRDFGAYQGKNHIQEYKNISNLDKPLEVLSKVFDVTIQGINDTKKILKESVYLQVLNKIVESKKLFFCGVGDAGIVAMEAQQKFLRAGVFSQFSSDPDIQLILANQLTKSDVCVAISHSGQTKSILETVKVAKGVGASIVLVSNYPNSPIAKESDFLLQTAVFSTSITGEVLSKRVTALCLIESIYVNYLIMKGPAQRRILESSNLVVGKNKFS